MTPNTNFVGQHTYIYAFQNQYRAYPPNNKNFIPNQSFVETPFNSLDRIFLNTEMEYMTTILFFKINFVKDSTLNKLARLNLNIFLKFYQTKLKII